MNEVLTTDSPSVDVVEAIAEAEGSNPLDLEFVLIEHIDSDALDSFSANSKCNWSVFFTVAGHEVTVNCDGSITVDGEQYQ